MSERVSKEDVQAVVRQWHQFGPLPEDEHYEQDFVVRICRDLLDANDRVAELEIKRNELGKALLWFAARYPVPEHFMDTVISANTNRIATEVVAEGHNAEDFRPCAVVMPDGETIEVK